MYLRYSSPQEPACYVSNMPGLADKSKIGLVAPKGRRVT